MKGNRAMLIFLIIITNRIKTGADIDSDKNRHQFFLHRAGKFYQRGRLCTIDLLVLTSLHQLLYMLKILIYLFTKHPTLMRRSTVLSPPPQLVFPDRGAQNPMGGGAKSCFCRLFNSKLDGFNIAR